MSRKPYIKIFYPDASQIAMLLTEAMVRRASGKRVVETESSERESAGQDLFAGSLCCVTETSVELTLNLAPEAMDFALATLIAKNLTQSERDQAMAASDSLELDALFSPRAGEAAEQALHVGSSPDVPSAEQEAATQSGEQEEKIEIEKVSEKKLRDILNDMIERMEKGHGTFDAVNHAIWEIKQITDEVPVEQIKPTGAPGEDYSDIERLILNCLNDHLPDADYLTKTGIMHDMTRRLKLNIGLRTKQHKAGLLSSATLRMILHDMVDALGSSYAPGVVVSHIDAAVEEIDRECHSIELEDYEATNAITAQLGLAIRYILALNDNKKDKRIHALFVLGQKIKEWYGHDVNINSYDIERAADKADEIFDETPPSSADPIDMLNEIRKYLEDGDPSWDDVEAEARQMQAPAPKQSAAPRADKNTADTEQDGEIEPGLLNDIDTEGEDHVE